MQEANLQDENVGNLGDILKHAALIQLAKVFAENISTEKYYLDSHSYLYQSRLATEDWQTQVARLLAQSPLYQDYIDIETPYIASGDYLCSSGLVHGLMPEAHLLLCETNRDTREWLLQQLADNKVGYHTVKAQMLKWVKGKSFKKLPNLLALIDPFELTDELWRSLNQCLAKMLDYQAPALMLVFDYRKTAERAWPKRMDTGLTNIAGLSSGPYHLAVYASADLIGPVTTRLKALGWQLAT